MPKFTIYSPGDRPGTAQPLCTIEADKLLYHSHGAYIFENENERIVHAVTELPGILIISEE